MRRGLASSRVLFLHLHNWENSLCKFNGTQGAITCAATETTHMCWHTRVHVCFPATDERAHFLASKQQVTCSAGLCLCVCERESVRLNEAVVDSCTLRGRWCCRMQALRWPECVYSPACARDLLRPTHILNEHAHLLFIDYAEHSEQLHRLELNFKGWSHPSCHPLSENAFFSGQPQDSTDRLLSFSHCKIKQQLATFEYKRSRRKQEVVATCSITPCINKRLWASAVTACQ